MAYLVYRMCLAPLLIPLHPAFWIECLAYQTSLLNSLSSIPNTLLDNFIFSSRLANFISPESFGLLPDKLPDGYFLGFSSHFVHTNFSLHTIFLSSFLLFFGNHLHSSIH
ncbi:unnamed protein product [Ilex paraguariensis]|uniref:Uncharacterized protein n=1 Tax=Ilex paraguariensis TaxID=185542 RepID=A0ABC8UX58_9AQUA